VQLIACIHETAANDFFFCDSHHDIDEERLHSSRLLNRFVALFPEEKDEQKPDDHNREGRLEAHSKTVVVRHNQSVDNFVSRRQKVLKPEYSSAKNKSDKIKNDQVLRKGQQPPVPECDPQHENGKQQLD
jgi:hypothetical protein